MLPWGPPPHILYNNKYENRIAYKYLFNMLLKIFGSGNTFSLKMGKQMILGVSFK